MSEPVKAPMPSDPNGWNKILPAGIGEPGDVNAPSLLATNRPGVVLVHVGHIEARVRAMEPSMARDDLTGMLCMFFYQSGLMLEQKKLIAKLRQRI